MQDQVWMRRRRDENKINFNKFVKHVEKGETGLNNKKVSDSGWIVKSVRRKSKEVTRNFIFDKHLETYKNRSCNILMSDEDVAKMVLIGELHAGVL